MALYIVCYEQQSGGMSPEEFELCVEPVGAPFRVQGGVWLFRANHQPPGLLMSEITENMARRGDSLALRRPVIVAEIQEWPDVINTYGDRRSLLDFLHSR